MKYIYGPIVSRRLGRSLGISPIPEKTCNYSCIYCQLGVTDHFINERKMFYPVSEMLDEFDSFREKDIPYDVVTIVGEGEPTLYRGLGSLIRGLKARTAKPVALITNGGLLYRDDVAEDCMEADIVLPTLDGYDERSFRIINRPHKTMDYETMMDGLRRFSHKYEGKLWLEIMLMKDVNDDGKSLRAYKSLLDTITYDRLFLNTPIRPPAVKGVSMSDDQTMKKAEKMLHGTAINVIGHETFASADTDDLTAVLNIIKRHPMNEYEIKAFLSARHHGGADVLESLKHHPDLSVSSYRGMDVYTHVKDVSS